MINITNINTPQSKNYPHTIQNQPHFCGIAPAEKLAKDVYVGVRDTLIQETAFFREPEMLEFVKEYITTRLKNKPEINIIDGACSKGYETYTLAMMLDKIGKKVNITGFDIGNQAITEAKKGVFLIKKLCGNEDTIEAYRLGMDAYNDDYLAFSNTSPLNLKQQEYRKVFYDFFTEIQNYKEKRSLFERMREILFSKFTPYFKTKAFKIKPEKADTCKFVQGNILKLDEIVPAHSADVLLFRNALYHLTTQEGPLGFKIQLPDAYIIPTVEDVVKEVDKALAPKGIFVIGEHPSDHTLTVGKTLYNELEKHNFSPVFKNSDGSMSLIWMKNR